MTRPILFAAAALVVSAALTPALAGATLDRVTSSKTLTNVLVNDYPPFSFINDKNEVDGFDVDVAREVAKKLGVSLKIETPAWEAIVAGKWQGRWDVCICSMTPSKERAELLDFPVHYYDSPAVLVVHKDETRIKSAADINGRKVGVGSGSTYEAYLQKNLVIEAPGFKPIVYPFERVDAAPYASETVAFQDLALGPGKRLDAVVGNFVTTKQRVDETGEFRIIGAPLYAEPNWVATDKGDAEWNATVARIIGELRADGTLARISQKWIKADITGGGS